MVRPARRPRGGLRDGHRRSSFSCPRRRGEGPPSDAPPCGRVRRHGRGRGTARPSRRGLAPGMTGPAAKGSPKVTGPSEPAPHVPADAPARAPGVAEPPLARAEPCARPTASSRWNFPGGADVDPRIGRRSAGRHGGAGAAAAGQARAIRPATVGRRAGPRGPDLWPAGGRGCRDLHGLSLAAGVKAPAPSGPGPRGSHPSRSRRMRSKIRTPVGMRASGKS